MSSATRLSSKLLAVTVGGGFVCFSLVRPFALNGNASGARNPLDYSNATAPFLMLIDGLERGFSAKLCSAFLLSIAYVDQLYDLIWLARGNGDLPFSGMWMSLSTIIPGMLNCLVGPSSFGYSFGVCLVSLGVVMAWKFHLLGHDHKSSMLAAMVCLLISPAHWATLLPVILDSCRQQVSLRSDPTRSGRSHQLQQVREWNDLHWLVRLEMAMRRWSMAILLVMLYVALPISLWCRWRHQWWPNWLMTMETVAMAESSATEDSLIVRIWWFAIRSLGGTLMMPVLCCAIGGMFGDVRQDADQRWRLLIKLVVASVLGVMSLAIYCYQAVPYLTGQMPSHQ